MEEEKEEEEEEGLYSGAINASVERDSVATGV